MGHQPLRITEPLIVPAALDPEAVKIIRRLKRFGHEAYLVGGCVRDLSLGHIPKDFDIATSARPRQVKRLFRNSRIIGRRFKLVHIQFGSKVIEVSTFRKNPGADTGPGDGPFDGEPLDASAPPQEPPFDEQSGDRPPEEYPQSRDADAPDARDDGGEPREHREHDGHGDRFDRDRDPRRDEPHADRGGDRADDGGEEDDDEREDLLIRRDNVFGNAEQDAIRRDFTVNGLFYDVDDNVVIDYVGGTADLERRVIRTIGDPDIRFQEDPVRILRAIKFAARLGFEIEPETLTGLERYKLDLEKCAAARLTEELLKLLSCGAARRAWELLDSTGVLSVFLPELADFVARDARFAEFDGSARALLLRYLEALDEMDRGRRQVSNAILLAVMLAGPIREEMLSDNGSRDPGIAVDRVLRPFQRRLSVSRRDSFQIKQVVIAQSRLLKQRSGRRRRLKPAGLVTRDYFLDALDFFRIECRVLGRDESEVRFWENLHSQMVEYRGQHRGQWHGGREEFERDERDEQAAPDSRGPDEPLDRPREDWNAGRGRPEDDRSFDDRDDAGTGAPDTGDMPGEEVQAGAPRSGERTPFDDRGGPPGSPGAIGDDGGHRRRRRRRRRGRGGAPHGPGMSGAPGASDAGRDPRDFREPHRGPAEPRDMGDEGDRGDERGARGARDSGDRGEPPFDADAPPAPMEPMEPAEQGWGEEPDAGPPPEDAHDRAPDAEPAEASGSGPGERGGDPRSEQPSPRQGPYEPGGGREPRGRRRRGGRGRRGGGHERHEPREAPGHAEEPGHGGQHRGRGGRGGRGGHGRHGGPGGPGGPSGRHGGGPPGQRLEFDEMRAGPLRPAALGPGPIGPADAIDAADAVEDDELVEIDWEAPFAKIDDPGPISVIRTGIDQTEKKSRRRRRRKDGAQRELAKEIEDQPGMQALKMTEGDPRGHQTARPQKPRRKPEDERLKERAKPFDFERDFESIDTVFPW